MCFRRRCFSVLISAVTICVARSIACAQSVVISTGVQTWLDAARTSRADMLILGDSVVWAGGNGWDAGLINGMAQRTGLAGTGLIPDNYYTYEGEGIVPTGAGMRGSRMT
jgi:hypothetical protein